MVLATWDVDSGLHVGAASVGTAPDPLAALRALPALAKPESSALLVLPNFHRFLGSPEIVQCLANTLRAGKTARTFVVILSPLVQIPLELERQFVVLEHHLPGRDQLQKIAQGVATEAGELPAGEDLDQLLDAALGLTRSEAENAFSLGLIRQNRLVPETVWDLKTQAQEKWPAYPPSRRREIRRLRRLGSRQTVLPAGPTPQASHRFSARHPSAGGARNWKKLFCQGSGERDQPANPGAGCRRLLGSLVGQSEANIRQALRIVDAMAPCVLFCDEVEKALSGVASSGQTDSGVSAGCLARYWYGSTITSPMCLW